MIPHGIWIPAHRATGLAFAAIVAGIMGATLAPRTAVDLEALLWVLAVIPAFLLAYHRGWSGLAAVLAAVMAALALVQAGIALFSVPMQTTGPVLRLLLIAVGTTAGIGVLAELYQQARVRAERLELQDPLTGMPNERHAGMVLAREVAAADRGRPVAVVLFQIDDITSYQLRHGRAAADGLLVSLSRAVRAETRRMNFSARSGNRFISILSSGSPEGALVFARKVQAAFARQAGVSRRVSVSGGIAMYDPTVDTPEKLTQAADHALYRAQQGGAGSFYVYEPKNAGKNKNLLSQFRSLRGSPA